MWWQSNPFKIWVKPAIFRPVRREARDRAKPECYIIERSNTESISGLHIHSLGGDVIATEQKDIKLKFLSEDGFNSYE